MKSTAYAVRILIAGLLIGLFGIPDSMGGGQDTALLKDFREVFPSAARGRILVPGSSRFPQMMEVWNGENLLGYGVDLKVMSRSGQFRVLVAVSPEEKVMDVLIPDYPHKRGRAVRKPSFLSQFKGFSYGEPLKLGEQVDGVSGATSSASAVTGGVRKALILVHRHNSGR